VQLGEIADRAASRVCTKWLEKPAIFSQSSKYPGFFAFCSYLIAGKAVSSRASGVKMASRAPKPFVISAASPMISEADRRFSRQIRQV
jgi:hypothetical protein